MTAATLRPFFTYYGGKWRLAPKYPPAIFTTIIEPFAGSAGYSLRHPDHEVRLYDVDPIICGLWDYLINVDAAEIMRLPIEVDHVDNLTVCQEAKWLIGFWLNKGSAGPCKVPSKWMRDGLRPNSQWGEVIRERVASQVDHIRHWRISQASFEAMPSSTIGTWFVDPPYNNDAGSRYRFHDVDYVKLGEWCRSLQGQVMVCEQEGADWLAFAPFAVAKGTEGQRRTGRSAEAIWYGV